MLKRLTLIICISAATLLINSYNINANIYLDDLNKSFEKVQKQTESPQDNDSKPNKNQSKNFKGGENLKDKLEYLRELLDSGLITKAEYDKKRFKLLDQI